MPPSPPLDLFLEVTTSSGRRFKWDGNQPDGSRPRNLSFRSKLGEGFSDASLQLTRRIDLDYPDLELLNDVTITGADGSVVYEGRISALPREMGDTYSIGVTLTGHMAHAKDQKMTGVYVDRDLGGWGGMSTARKADLLTASGTPYDAESSADPTDNSAVVATAWTGGWGATFFPHSEAWYDAGPGNLIGSVRYSWTRESGNVNQADANWLWAVYVSSDDKVTASDNSGNLRAAGPSLLQTFSPTTARRYAMLKLSYGAGPVTGDGVRFAVNWSKVAVYGDHGLSLKTGEATEPPGVTASDVIKHVITRWCPALNTRGVQDTSYVIQHLAFRDPIDPYDVFLQCNKYHLFHLGVWENRTVHFRPYNLEDYDWEIRTDDPGTTFAPQGASIDDLNNGIAVSYTNLLTGIKHRLTPATHPELKDTSTTNPWNKHGMPRTAELELSTPTLENQALQIGRAALGERNRPKTPGTITVKGHIRDRAGNWRPCSKVRAGDTISITNFPNDSPRLIHDALFDDDSKTATLAIDAPAAQLDAYLDRLSTALQAKGLG